MGYLRLLRGQNIISWAFFCWVGTASLANCTARSDTGATATEGTAFALSEKEVAADGVAEAVVDIWVRDGDGNPQMGWHTQLVSDDLAQIQQPTSRTDHAGHVQATIRKATPGTVHFKLVAGPNFERLQAPGRGQVRFFATENSLGNQVKIQVPLVASVDADALQPVVVTVLDINGDAVTGAHVSLSSDQASDSFVAHADRTDANGEIRVGYRSTIAGLKTIHAATKQQASVQANIQFLPGAPDNEHILFLNAGGSGITADGVTDNMVRIFVGDRFGNPVPNIPVAVASIQSAIAATPPSGHSDKNGFFVTTLISSTVGSADLSVQVASHAQDHALVLVPGTVSAATSTLTANPNRLVSYDGSKTRLSACLLDAASHPIANQQVVWHSDHADDVFDANITVSDANGIAQTGFASSTPRMAQVQAQAGQILLTTPVDIFDDRPSALYSNVVISPNTLVAGNSAGLSIAVNLRDGTQSPVPNAHVSWSASDASGVFSAVEATSDSQGQATTSWTSQHSGPVTITASFAGGSANAKIVVVPGPADASTSELFVLSPAGAIADGNTAITLRGRFADAYNNPISDRPVVLDAQATRWISGRYSADAGTNKDWRGVSNNGQSLATWKIFNSGAWDSWFESERYALPLSAVSNRFVVVQSSYPPSNWDALRLWTYNHPVLIQAEEGSLSGGATVETQDPDYTGTGFVDSHAINDASVSFDIFAAPGDLHRSFSMRYSSGWECSGYQLVLNGQTLNRPFAEQTEGWDSWYVTTPYDITLSPGHNTLTLVNQNPPINIDYILLQDNQDATSVQCEDGEYVNGSAKNNNWGGYQGSGFVDFFARNGAGFAIQLPGTGDTMVPVQPVTDSNGYFSASITARHAESKVLLATLDAVTQTQSLTFSTASPSADASSFELASDTAVTGQDVLMGFKAVTSTGDAVPSISVHLASSSDTCTVHPGDAVVTDSRGVGSATVTCSSTGTVELCASFDSFFQRCRSIEVSAAP